VELNDRVTQLEDEIKILKGEIQAVLLDLRENLLNRENPFTSASSPSHSNQPIIINNQQPQSVEKSDVVVQHEKPDAASHVTKESQVKPETTELSKSENEKSHLKRSDAAIHEHGNGKDIDRERGLAETLEVNINGKKMLDSSNGKLELSTITALVHWGEASVVRLGPGITQAILDVSETIGDMSPELKTLLVKLIHSDQPQPCRKIIPHDYLKSVMELNNILGRNSRSDSLLYSLYALCSTPGGNGDG